MALLDIFKGIFGNNSTEEVGRISRKPVVGLSEDYNINELPSGRVSQPNNKYTYQYFSEELAHVDLQYDRNIISIIRKLVKVNPNYKQALHNIETQANTGHRIKFDSRFSAEEQEKMRDHLRKVQKNWAEGCTGMDSFISKLIRQVMITGACSLEWVPKMSLEGIDKVTLVAPENIYFFYNRETQRYEPYQRLLNIAEFNDREDDRIKETAHGSYIKLNPHTYKYYAYNSDVETPYGHPPYMAALEATATQRVMMDNIKYLVSQLGLMGFMQALADKPDQKDDESNTQYKKRLENFLSQLEKRIHKGFRKGMVVGYKDDLEFSFNSITKDARGVQTLFSENELQIFSGLSSDASLHGRGYNTSETQISVIFNKMLSELSSIQTIVGRAIEYGYLLELKLSGYNIDSLEVEFSPSTILDDLKMQQAKEYKIRNNIALYKQGIISQDQFADDMGFEKPDQEEPREDFEDGNREVGTPEDEAKRKKREKDKDDSDKKTREKDSPKRKAK